MRWLSIPLLLVLLTVSEAHAEPVTAESVHAAIDANELTKAESLAKKLVRLTPDDVEAHYAAARIAYVLGSYRVAEEHLDRGLEIDPDSMELAGLAAMICLQENRDEEARSIIALAMTVDPTAQNVRTAVDELIVADKARAHAGGERPLPSGSPEAHVDAFVRAARATAPEDAPSLDRFFSPAMTDGIPVTSEKDPLGKFLTGVLEGAHGAATQSSIIGWYVEAIPDDTGGDEWVRLVVVASMVRTPAEIDALLGSADVASVAGMIDPGFQAAIEAASSGQRRELAHRLLGAPRRVPSEILFAVRGAGSTQGITDVHVNGASIRELLTVIGQSKAEHDERDRKRSRNLFILAVIVGVFAVTWVFWYTTNRRQQARRAARRRRAID